VDYYKLYVYLGKILFYLLFPVLFLHGAIIRKPRVRAVITYDNHIFLVKNWLSGQRWTFPGGGVEIGEADTSALSRELYEEIGMNVMPDALIHIANYKRIYRWSLTKISVFHLNATSYDDVRYRFNTHELVDSKWFHLDNLPPNVGSEVRRVLIDDVKK
jgi:ADP-ribose pyrophosphatase YjhB (NUDIX family)